MRVKQEMKEEEKTVLPLYAGQLLWATALSCIVESFLISRLDASAERGKIILAATKPILVYSFYLRLV